jgi:hypothetical protein
MRPNDFTRPRETIAQARRLRSVRYRNGTPPNRFFNCYVRGSDEKGAYREKNRHVLGRCMFPGKCGESCRRLQQLKCAPSKRDGLQHQNITSRHILASSQLGASQADWGHAAEMPALLSRLMWMPRAGAILLVSSAHRGPRTDGSCSSAQAEAMNRQGKCSDKRDVRTAFHFRLVKVSLARHFTAQHQNFGSVRSQRSDSMAN